MLMMFFGCESLTNLNLSNFNTQNVTDMNGMFFDSESLTIENIIANENRIIKQYLNDEKIT